MIGNNTIYMNQATVIEAVQRYLTDEFVEKRAPTVTRVKPHQDGGFVVLVSGMDDEEESK